MYTEFTVETRNSEIMKDANVRDSIASQIKSLQTSTASFCFKEVASRNRKDKTEDPDCQTKVNVEEKLQCQKMNTCPKWSEKTEIGVIPNTTSVIDKPITSSKVHTDENKENS